MSQRKEKYHRQEQRFGGYISPEDLQWHRDRRARDERRRVEALRSTVWALACMVCAACVTVLALVVSVDGREAEGPGKGQAVEPVVMPETVVPRSLNTIENARITFYCACAKCCGQWADGTTASGAPAQEGVTVATDPSLIPLGSEVLVGGQWYTAQDTGVTGAAVDVFVEDHQRALALGVRTETVYWTEGAT